jgi:hypothetical protein
MNKTTTQIIGSFVFRNEGDGCLTSKYHHSDSVDGPLTEACKLTTTVIPNDAFVGTYRTVWLDEKNIHVAAELSIARKSPHTNLFELIWRDANMPSKILFEGSGMLYGDLLVGCYWD